MFSPHGNGPGGFRCEPPWPIPSTGGKTEGPRHRVQGQRSPSHLSNYPAGVFMATYYQVCMTYKLSGQKRSLVGMTLHSTSVFYPLVDCPSISILCHSRYFHTQAEAYKFIDYLYSIYPTSTVPRPTLDPLQPLFF